MSPLDNNAASVRMGEQHLPAETAFDSAIVDVAANRAAKKYEWHEQLRRVLWSFGSIVFRLSPRPMFGWRRMILRLFGAQIGHHVNVYPTTKLLMPWNVVIDDWAALGENVFIYSLGKVRIGRSVTISYRAHICAGTHDFADPTCPLLKPPVTIEEGAWIGTDAFIGPNVTIGRHAMVGARAVVLKSVQPLHVVVGNPAQSIRVRQSH